MSHTSPHDIPPELREGASWWQRNLSMIILTGFFAVLALAVPMDWIEHVQDIFKVEPIHTQTTFMESTAQLDAALDRGEPVEEPGRLRALRQDIIIRRLLRAGPLNGEEVRAIKGMLIEIDEQASKESEEETRQAWYVMRQRKLVTGYPRLDPRRVEEQLKLFERQYAEAMKGE